MLLLTGLAWQVRASDPVGIYGYIDKVVLEPSETSPERVQIFGGFAMAEGGGEKYAPAEKGFLYYTINPTKPEVCLKEWKDLKSLAGTGQIVSFAGRYAKKGKVHPAGAKAESPDVYPLGFGLTKVKESDYTPVKELVELEKEEGRHKSIGQEQRRQSELCARPHHSRASCDIHGGMPC